MFIVQTIFFNSFVLDLIFTTFLPINKRITLEKIVLKHFLPSMRHKAENMFFVAKPLVPEKNTFLKCI